MTWRRHSFLCSRGIAGKVRSGKWAAFIPFIPFHSIYFIASVLGLGLLVVAHIILQWMAGWSIWYGSECDESEQNQKKNESENESENEN